MTAHIRTLLDGRCTMHVGDCIEVMRCMPANSVDCVVTSPPYWGLRDYGVAGQIGLEPTLGEHLQVMVDVFREYKPAKGSTAGQNREGTWVETYVPDLRNGRNVWTFNIEGCREAHFATFPRELARRCILAGAPKTVCGCCGAAEGCGPICESFERVPGVVLDPFGGSGTVGLVAEKYGYRSALIELNPKYADIAERRITGVLAAAIKEDEVAA